MHYVEQVYAASTHGGKIFLCPHALYRVDLRQAGEGKSS